MQTDMRYFVAKSRMEHHLLKTTPAEEVAESSSSTSSSSTSKIITIGFSPPPPPLVIAAVHKEEEPLSAEDFFSKPAGPAEEEDEEPATQKAPQPPTPQITFSPDQTRALDLFVRGENLFLSGEAGTGKSALVHAFVAHCRQRRLDVQVCALTGCAAVMLGAGARTLHSFCGLATTAGKPVDVVVEGLLRSRKNVARWRKLQVLIVDEVSMMSQKLFEIVEETLRRSRRSGRSFGGLQVVFCGDFFQLPPVRDRSGGGGGGGDEDDSARFCFESPQWSRLFPAAANHVVLRTLFRQRDPEYARILGQVRRGRLDAASIATLQTYVCGDDDGGCGGSGGENEEEEDVPPAPKLFAVRYKVDQINARQFRALPADAEEAVVPHASSLECRTYLDDAVGPGGGTPIEAKLLARTLEFTRTDKEAMLRRLSAPHTVRDGDQGSGSGGGGGSGGGSGGVRLKVGAVVMCTANLDLDAGVCNGAQGVVVGFRTAASAVPEQQRQYQAPVVRFHNGVVRQIHRVFVHDELLPIVGDDSPTEKT